MKFNQYKIDTKVWLYPGSPTGGGSWHFITIPSDISTDITKSFGDMKRGWGSLPVNVTLGSTSWKTSIFPDKKTSTYLLPLKADIRKSENIQVGDTINLLLEILI